MIQKTNKLSVFKIDSYPKYDPQVYRSENLAPGYFGDIKADAFCGRNEEHCHKDLFSDRNCLLYQEYRL